jgi:hypothetical protein
MQDYDLWTRIVKAGFKIGNVPEFLLWFRIEKGFFSRRAGINRALAEVSMRREFARSVGLLRYGNYLRYAGLIAVRTAPVFLKKLFYKYLRTTRMKG